MHRRLALQSLLLAGSSGAVLTAAATTETAAAAHGQSAPQSTNQPASLSIVDTNVSLFQWPFRRLPTDTTDKLLTKLRSLGVTRALAGSFEGLFHRNLTDANQRLATECARHPELIPIGTVNPSQPGWRNDFEICLNELAMPGIRLHPGCHNYQLTNPAVRQLLELATNAGVFVQLTAAVEDRRTQPQLYRTTDVDLLPLCEVCRDLPGLRLQLLNSRPAIGLVERLSEVPGLTFDTARLEGTDGVPRLFQSLGKGRVMFGSHAPFLIPEASLIRIYESGTLPPDDVRLILEGGEYMLVRKPA